MQRHPANRREADKAESRNRAYKMRKRSAAYKNLKFNPKRMIMQFITYKIVSFFHETVTS
ncbi:hypothetical protein Q765_09985 [Flavobacterium rivuli WB 3.3-2 = DSM 21788]|uniref:Uncharacterized protein n=1 Tax=Flavobacterium rivuli WB 3.3-2 = DSM 21788 TaxID=1121895 RepID=A0A0A2M2Q9_9FLAO|nr:hypothetical protein [Flavobacterium rivuli]KGO86549.1 hypothetical protein Q765_09985 [Flavobacterium rivuli WB 3.3-2 = DSM 21788]